MCLNKKICNLQSFVELNQHICEPNDNDIENHIKPSILTATKIFEAKIQMQLGCGLKIIESYLYGPTASCNYKLSMEFKKLMRLI